MLAHTQPGTIMLLKPELRPPHQHIFFFNAPETTEIYTLSLHDALPIFLTHLGAALGLGLLLVCWCLVLWRRGELEDRKSTRLNSSHLGISYAVFCLKKKNK